MNKTYMKRIALLSTGLVLAACSDTDFSVPPPVVVTPPPPVMVSFDVTATNLTNAQPLSPVAVIAHDSGFQVFEVGGVSSAELEVLAEGGDNSDLIALADGSDAVIVTASGANPIGPGANETVSFTFEETDLATAGVSVTTMLVNTNDAITGINGYDLSGMAVGDVRMIRARAYDAGTEADTEEAAHVPGPAGGGEGFNAARDDEVDYIAVHKGVVTADDGLLFSALTEQHRFDNPVIQIRIERTE